MGNFGDELLWNARAVVYCSLKFEVWIVWVSVWLRLRFKAGGNGSWASARL